MSKQEKKTSEEVIRVVCPNCNARYYVALDTRDRIPKGTSATAICKKCSGRIVIESNPTSIEIPKGALTMPIKYTVSKTIDVAHDTLRDNRLVAFFHNGRK